MRPRLLDLFCKAGGAGKGYALAGFEVVGVDIAPQPRYPFEFVQGDALEFVREHAHEFDAIHASPPCQAYSILRNAAADKGAGQLDLVGPTRDALVASGLPYVIENVPGAPLSPYSIMLCGSMFGLGAGERQLRRHRLFETTVPMLQMSCWHRGEAIGVYGGGAEGRYTFANGAPRDPYGRKGAWQGTAAEKREAMGIDWMTRDEVNQAIPPAYTEHIGGYLMVAVTSKEAVA